MTITKLRMGIGLLTAILAANAATAQVGSPKAPGGNIEPVHAQPTSAPSDNATFPELATPTLVPRTTPPIQAAPVAAAKSKSADEPINDLIDVLMTSATPMERHLAIRGLAKHDWRKSPQILAAFVKAARVDSNRAVRVDAIRYIAALKMNVPYVVEHLKYIQKDRDEWVAEESTGALDKLQASK